GGRSDRVRALPDSGRGGHGARGVLPRAPSRPGPWTVGGLPLRGRPGRGGERAVRSGYRGIEVVKRYTSLGSGICQGRYCLPDALLLLSILEDRPPAE